MHDGQDIGLSCVGRVQWGFTIGSSFAFSLRGLQQSGWNKDIVVFTNSVALEVGVGQDIIEIDILEAVL